MKKTVTGKIFIIPNHPYTKKELGWYDMKNWDKWAEKAQSLLNNFDGDITVKEPMIQVWAGNDDCDNFACHQMDYAEMIGVVNPGFSYDEMNEEVRKEMRNKIYNNSFPTHLPYTILKDLKEGDTLTLNRKDGVEIILEVSQETTRYARFGKFEEVLENLVH